MDASDLLLMGQIQTSEAEDQDKSPSYSTTVVQKHSRSVTPEQLTSLWMRTNGPLHYRCLEGTAHDCNDAQTSTESLLSHCYQT